MATISPTPVSAHLQHSRRSALEYLLLGDLLEVLESPDSAENRRWVLAILDMVLAMPDAPGNEASADGHSNVLTPRRVAAFNDRTKQLWQERTILFFKFQRLRDRLAHHAPCSLIINEIRCDLRDLLAI